MSNGVCKAETQIDVKLAKVDLYWCCVERSSQDFADQAPPDPITLDTPLFHPQPHHLLFRPQQRHHHHHHQHHHSHHHQHHADGIGANKSVIIKKAWTFGQNVNVMRTNLECQNCTRVKV